ncbi:MAG TPA: endonuclease domain-containing protein [Noviherbaspirillum sp.]
MSLNDRLRINPQTTKNARTLRSGMTLAEQRLWNALRGKQIENTRFRRQHPIGPYIADFACVEQLLIVELDGGQHQEQIEYDDRRTAFLQQQGWKVLRFWNNDVMSNLDGVLSSIVTAFESAPPSQPSP